MTGVSSIDFSKERISANPHLSEQIRLDLIEKKAELENELELSLLAIKFIEQKLSKLSAEDKQVCLEIIARGMTYESVAADKGYTTSGLWRKVERELKNIL